MGVQPDILVCRSEHHLNSDIRNKIAKFCNVSQNAVIESIDAETIYDVPVLMKEEQLDHVVLEKLHMPSSGQADLTIWESYLKRFKNPKHTVNIGLIGKYIELKDSYKSIAESFNHAGADLECKVNIKWIHSEKVNDDNAKELLGDLDGVLVAPGFGSRGIEGKIQTIKYVRENNIPFFGICLGMQCAVIEFARHVLMLEDAHSTEIDENTKAPVIALMEEQKSVTNKGGTMRLGAYSCKLKEDSKAYRAYNESIIHERHRHRYEFNNEYLKAMEDKGFIATGINPDSSLVEIMELNDHPYFVGVQFHPEYKSTVASPAPLFKSFIKAAMDKKSRS